MPTSSPGALHWNWKVGLPQVTTVVEAIPFYLSFTLHHSSAAAECVLTGMLFTKLIGVLSSRYNILEANPYCDPYPFQQAGGSDGFNEQMRGEAIATVCFMWFIYF